MSSGDFWFQSRQCMRIGVKGPDAARLLADAGITIPATPNAIAHSDAAPGNLSRCLRLGSSEFLLEQDSGAETIEMVRHRIKAAESRAWCVLRSDYSALLGGPALFERLARICAFDLSRMTTQPDQVVMTLTADVSVTLALESASTADLQLRLWADPSYGTYLEQVLSQLSSPSLSTFPSHGEPA